MNFEHELIFEVVGKELYHKLCAEMGGLRVSFKKGERDSIWFYYQQGLSVKKLAYKFGVSERFIAKVINEKIKSKNFV